LSEFRVKLDLVSVDPDPAQVALKLKSRAKGNPKLKKAFAAVELAIGTNDFSGFSVKVVNGKKK
jgi:hypothetical protein